jgi:hypothetical protein
MEDSTESIQLSERHQGIMWVMIRPDLKNINSLASKILLQSRTFFSTSEYAEIPVYATDLFLPLVREVQDIWNSNFAGIQGRLLAMVRKSAVSSN